MIAFQFGTTQHIDETEMQCNGEVSFTSVGVAVIGSREKAGMISVVIGAGNNLRISWFSSTDCLKMKTIFLVAASVNHSKIINT